MAKRKRILYVEDNAAVRTIRTMMLEREGYDVVPAVNAAEALQAVSKGKLDLAVVDYGLPDARGDELCRVLKDNVPGLPVVLVSGTVPDLLPGSADLFLVKGENPRDLMNAIARLLDHR